MIVAEQQNSLWDTWNTKKYKTEQNTQNVTNLGKLISEISPGIESINSSTAYSDHQGRHFLFANFNDIIPCT